MNVRIGRGAAVHRADTDECLGARCERDRVQVRIDRPWIRRTDAPVTCKRCLKIDAQ